MATTAASLSPSTIAFDSSNEVVSFAAAELRAHLGIAGAGGSVAIELLAGRSPTDGFSLTSNADRIQIAGDSARGALNGVYWLLERLGFLWVRPGAEGVRFVPGAAIADGTYRESPAFGRRTLILGNDALHDEWRDWIEFASRNRYNSVFFHDTPPSVLDRAGATRPAADDEIARDGKGWMFERWDTDGSAIRAEAARRGLTLQFGGHHLPALLRRELFAEHPDWFPERNGARDARYNLCTSDPGARREIRDRAGAFFRRFAGAAVYHLWADDIVGGGWCSCRGCAQVPPSDQALHATNVLAEALAEVDSAAVVAHLAYHDTIESPKVFLPGKRVTALYAPRNRNYAYAIDDPRCQRNAQGHYAELLGLRETFAKRRNSLAVFEYYSDAILYKWLDPPNLRVLAQDARAYREAGVFDFGNLAVTPRPWVGPTWHAWWFARCAWDSNLNARSELERFCSAAYGTDGAYFARLYETLDDAYREFLDLGELERIARHDVLDFSDTPREALRLKAQQLRRAMETMNGAVSGLPLMPDGLGRGFREDIAVQLASANHIAARISAWDAALDGNMSEAERFLFLACLHLSALIDWDQAHTAPPYANLSRAMLQSASWHTERIAALIQK